MQAVSTRPQVDSKERPSKYHHGDLKNALVAIGREILESDGISGLSLREVSRRAGVSHAAPAHHFASMDAFLMECSESGFADFGKVLGAARAGATDAADAIAAMGRAYLGFAHANPSVFRLMFDRGGARRPSPTSSPKADAAYALLEQATEAISEAVSPEELDFRVTAIWALVHGYTGLMLEGHVGDDCAPSETILAEAQESASRALRALVLGMQA